LASSHSLYATLYAREDKYIFVDCSKESPEGRRNLCYDRAAQEVAEADDETPNGNAVDMAAAMGIDLLTIAEYRKLQSHGDFDSHSRTWLKSEDIDEPYTANVGFMMNNRSELILDPSEDHFENKGFRGKLEV